MVALILSSSVLLFCLSYFVQGQTVKSVEICLTLGIPLLKVNYSCESQEMIHVISVLHQEASPSCDPVPGGCQVLLESSTDGLTTECNGQQTCTTDITAFRLKKRCENIIDSLAMVSYECIRDKPIKMCSTRYRATPTLYLISPPIPKILGIDLTHSDDPCVCNITGTDMSVEILELYLLIDPQVRANLTLEGESDVWYSTSTFLAYNTLAITNTSHIKLTYDANGMTGQNAWIRVQGLGNITVDCNPSPATSSPTAKTTATTSTASTTYGDTTTTATNAAGQSKNVVTDRTSTSSVHVDTTTPTVDLVKLGDSNTPAIIDVLCGVIVILILVVAALVVYIKCVKPRRLLKSAYASPETTDGNYDHNTQDQISNPTQPTLNDQDPSDRTNADYADMTQYINLDNVYIELDPQEDNSEHLPSPGNTYSHPQIYSNEENSHEYSQISHV